MTDIVEYPDYVILSLPTFKKTVPSIGSEGTWMLKFLYTLHF